MIIRSHDPFLVFSFVLRILIGLDFFLACGVAVYVTQTSWINHHIQYMATLIGNT